MYKYIRTNGFINLMRTSDSVIIPINLANTDYQEYLEWVAEGNTPEEAE